MFVGILGNLKYVNELGLINSIDFLCIWCKIGEILLIFLLDEGVGTLKPGNEQISSLPVITMQ